MKFPGKKCYKGIRFNVISVTGVGGCQLSRKKCYVSLEWPLAKKSALKIIHLWRTRMDPFCELSDEAGQVL